MYTCAQILAILADWCPNMIDIDNFQDAYCWRLVYRVLIPYCSASIISAIFVGKTAPQILRLLGTVSRIILFYVLRWYNGGLCFSLRLKRDATHCGLARTEARVAREESFQGALRNVSKFS
jgi:hypothetical protein